MSDVKPGYVRVAEALGCQARHEPPYEESPPEWLCRCADGAHQDASSMGMVLAYDTDWSATGPLIEKFGISVWHPEAFNPAHGTWFANWGGVNSRGLHRCFYHPRTHGSTPLLAVCNLILALKEAGKL